MQKKTLYNHLENFLVSPECMQSKSSKIAPLTVRVVQLKPFLFTDDNLYSYELGNPLESFEIQKKPADPKEADSNGPLDHTSIQVNQKITLINPSLTLKKIPYKHEWFIDISCEQIQVLNQEVSTLNNPLLEKLRLKTPFENKELKYKFSTLTRKFTENLVREHFFRDMTGKKNSTVINKFQGKGVGLVLKKREWMDEEGEAEKLADKENSGQ